MKLSSFVAVALIFLLCSCSLFPPAPPDAKPHQSPKALAAGAQPIPKPVPPQETSKTHTTAPQQSPKAQAEAPPPAPPAPPPAETLEAGRKALLGVDLAFSRACEDKGAPEAFYQFVAPDGVCLLASEPPIQGRDAIKVYFAAGSIASISWKPRESEIDGNAEMGYTWGAYESQRAVVDNQPATTSGKYAIVWKKQADGSWKAVLFVTSPGPGAK